MPKQSYAYPGGLLDGVTMNWGQSAITNPTVNGSTKLVTDGNETTGVSIGFIINSSSLSYKFSTPQGIKSYKLKTNGQNPVYLMFYDATGKAIKTINSANANGTETTIAPFVQNVTYVQVSASNAVTVYEFDVFSSAYPSPSGLKATPDTQKLSLTWSGVSDPDFVAYDVYVDDVKVDSTTQTSYVMQDLKPDISYSIYVKARYKDGTLSSSSNTVSASAYDLPAEKPVITAESKETSLILSWSSARAVKYYLFYVNNQLITVTTDSTYEVKDLEMDKQYSFYVVAYDKYDRSTFSDVTTFGTRAPPPPVYPDIYVTSKTFDEINMFWNDVGLFYEIYLDGNLVKQQNGNIYNFSSLLPDTDYKIQVVSTDSYGRKNATNLVVHTNPLPAPAKPKLRVNSKSFDKFSVAWDAVGVSYVAILDGNAVGYTTNQGFSFEGLNPETNYKVQVESTDQFDRKIKSDVLTVKTDSIPPLDVPVLSKISLTFDSVRILWNSIAGISNYDVYQDGTKVGTSSGTFSQINDLEPSTNYSFTISYIDTFGRNVESKPLTVTTLAAPLPTPSPGPPVPPPAVSKSSNEDLNKANDQLVQGVKETKDSSISLITLIVIIFVLVFGSTWLMRIMRKKMKKSSVVSKSVNSKNGGITRGSVQPTTTTSSIGTVEVIAPGRSYSQIYGSSATTHKPLALGQGQQKNSKGRKNYHGKTSYFGKSRKRRF